MSETSRDYDTKATSRTDFNPENNEAGILKILFNPIQKTIKQTFG